MNYFSYLFLSLLLIIYLFIQFCLLDTMALVKMTSTIIRMLLHMTRKLHAVLYGWQYIRQIVFFNNTCKCCKCIRKVLSHLLITATTQNSAFFIYFMFYVRKNFSSRMFKTAMKKCIKFTCYKCIVSFIFLRLFNPQLYLRQIVI